MSRGMKGQFLTDNLIIRNYKRGRTNLSMAWVEYCNSYNDTTVLDNKNNGNQWRSGEYKKLYMEYYEMVENGIVSGKNASIGENQERNLLAG